MRVTSAAWVIPALLLLTVRVAPQDGGRREPEVRKDLHGDSLPQGARVRLGSRWLFHPAPILSLAGSPDGTVLAAGTEDGELRLWEAATGKPILRRRVGAMVHSVAFSPDGELIATTGDGGDVCLWEVETGGIRRRLKGHGAPVYALAFSPDGQYLVSGSAQEEAILVWSLTSESVVRIPRRALALVFTSDGTFAAASGRNSVDLWGVQGESIGQLTPRPIDPHPVAPLSLAWGRASGRLVTGGMDNTVRAWDTEARRELHVLEGHGDGVRSVAVSPDDTIAASGGEDGRVMFWSLTRGRRLASVQASEGKILAVTFIHDGKALVSAGSDGHVRFWETPTGSRASPVNTHAGRVTGVCILDDRVVTAGSDGTVRSWDLDSGRHLRLLESSDRRLTCLAYDPRSDLLASGDGAGTVMVMRRATANVVCRIDTEPISTVAFAGGGECLLTSSLDGTLRVWSLGAPERALETMRHDAAVTAMDVSPERDHVVIGCRDGTVVIRDACGEILARLDVSDRIAGVGFLNDDRVFAAQSEGMLRVWDSRTGGAISALRHPSGRVFSAARSPDGVYVVTAGEHGKVVLWQPPREEPLRVYEGHERLVSCLAFSADGKLLASGGWDGTVLVWETDATNRDRDTRK